MDRIIDEDGVWRTSQEEVGEVMVKYYKSLFTSTEGSVPASMLECVPTMINEEMNAVLCKDFKACEVFSALQQMAPLKAPGPDDPFTRKWNEELINGLFVEEDAELIKTIPLSRTVTKDSLYWPYSTSSHYTCKSGYRFLKQESEPQLNPQAPPICDKQALMRRKIVTYPICVRCNSSVEEPEHALWLCPELDVVWTDRGAWDFRFEVEFMDVKELLSWLIAEGKSLVLFAYTTWMVWNQRNKARLNLQAVLLHQVAKQTKEMLAQYRANLQIPDVQVINSGSGGTRWSCPQAGLVKINFDGAIFGESSMSSIGVVIRDSNRVVLASGSEKKILQAYKAEEIEVLAALKALSFAFELGFRSAILEGDSLGLIQALKSEESSLSPTGL
ncbi:uncharacterized protein LOC142626412 [Castanea sativa]|uniref:uncharacterized protein LOC142626412 n=1 Tax=Castanea sativa TaxID=21020 RepID=UPI003F6548D8